MMDSDLGKKIVRITDSEHNSSRTADLSMAVSSDLALKLHGSADPVPPLSPPPPLVNKSRKQLVTSRKSLSHGCNETAEILMKDCLVACLRALLLFYCSTYC